MEDMTDVFCYPVGMNNSNTSTPGWDRAERVLLRAFLLSIAFLLFWFVMILLAGDWAAAMHQWMFSISPEQFNLISYCGMGWFKLASIVMFLLPWLAIRSTRG